MKTCHTCNLNKPLESFHLDRYKADGRTSNCKLCVRAYGIGHRVRNRDRLREQWRLRHVGGRAEKSRAKQRRSYYKHHSKRIHAVRNYYYAHPEYQRDVRLRKSYGVGHTQWEKMYALQDGKCAICSAALDQPRSKGGKRAAFIDHDHSNGRVRGLLCRSCNSGKVGSNTVVSARKVLQYLESSFDARSL